MKRRITRLYFLLGLTVMFLSLTSLSGTEILHSWFEANPDHPYQYGDVTENVRPRRV